jgi:CrcB protein
MNGIIYGLLFVGGGIGTMLRHAVNIHFARWFGAGFPFHTLFENVTGSLVMGLLAGYFAFRAELPQELRLFLMTGVIGGYTTFSAFSLDAVLLWERGEWLMSFGYAAGSVMLSILGLFIGLALMRTLA